MSDRLSAEKDVQVLRCIYCQRTILWSKGRTSPSACRHCGLWPGAYENPVIASDKPGEDSA